MRILYLHQHFCPPEGAGNNRSYELGTEWQALGHEVTIVCGSGNFKEALPFWILAKKEAYNELTVIRLNVPYSHFMPFWRRSLAFLQYLLFALLYSFRLSHYDIVYASSTPLSVGVLGIWCKWKLSARLVFETVDLWPDVPVEMGLIKNSIMINWLYRMEKWIYHNSERIVCLSEGMQDRILEKGVTEKKVVVAHNGSNTSLFLPVDNKSSLKKALGFNEDDFIVLYAGTVGMANGIEFLIQTASLVQDKGNQKVIFLIIGEGNRSLEIKKMLLSSILLNIKWLNSIPKNEVISYFQAADVGVVLFAPYKILETNSANKFFDYLASGLPVLINYMGWQKAYLDKYRCGCSEISPEEMAEKIHLLASSPVQCATLGKAGRELAVTHFDRKIIAKNLASVFSHTL